MAKGPDEAATFDVEAWRQPLDAFGDLPFPDIFDDEPVEPDDTIAFD